MVGSVDVICGPALPGVACVRGGTEGSVDGGTGSGGGGWTAGAVLGGPAGLPLAGALPGPVDGVTAAGVSGAAGLAALGLGLAPGFPGSGHEPRWQNTGSPVFGSLPV